MSARTVLTPTLAAADAAMLDDFLRAAPFAAYQQMRAWMAAAPGGARREWRCFLHVADGRAVGGAIVRYTRLPLNARLATIHRGPIVADPADLPRVLAALAVALRRDGCCSVQAGPRVRGRALPDVADAMRAAGYVPLPAGRRPLHDVTAMIWLDKPEGEVLAGFKQRGRRAIKAAAQAGITVRVAQGVDDVAAFQAMLDRFAAARPDYDMGGQPDAAGQAALVAAAGGAMLLAERDGAVVGAHAYVVQADEAIWLSLATADEKGASPGYALLWAAMRHARAAGCIGYDVAGMPDGEPADAGEAGRVQFKTAFAPLRRVLLPVQVAALSPVRHAVLFGARQAYRAWRDRG